MTTAEELRKEGREEALKKAKQEREALLKKAAEKSAKKAFKKGFDLETVADIVELPLDELMTIKKEIDIKASN